MTSVRLLAFFITLSAGVILVFVAFTLGRIGNILRATFAALNQTGEQENAPRGRTDFAVLVFVIFQTVLHSKPNLHIDNRGNRAVNAYLSRIRFPANIFPHDLVCIFIPNINPCVAGIFEHIIQGIFVHWFSFSTDDAGDLQLVHDVIIGIPLIIQIERLADKLCFGRDDNISLVFNGVPIGRIAAEEFPFAGGGGNTVHRFLPSFQYHVLTEANGDKLPQKIVGIQWITELLVAGNDIHAKLTHLLSECKPIGNISGAAAHVINDDGGKFFCAGGSNHILESGAVSIRAGLPFVDEAVCQPDIIFCTVTRNLVHLIGNRIVGLIVGGIAGIRRRCRFHSDASFWIL